MFLNAGKTKISNVSSLIDITVQGNITVDTLELETVESAKLLGVSIDSHLTFKPHVINARKRRYTLILLKRSGLNKVGLLRMYTATTRPVIAHAAPAWYTTINKTSYSLRSSCLVYHD